MEEEESSVSHLKEGLHHLASKVDDLRETVKEHIDTDKLYYKEIDKLISNEENEGMNVMEIPAVIGGNDNAALIAALMGNRWLETDDGKEMISKIHPYLGSILEFISKPQS